jgi:hypothetical protein
VRRRLNILGSFRLWVSFGRASCTAWGRMMIVLTGQ